MKIEVFLFGEKQPTFFLSVKSKFPSSSKNIFYEINFLNGIRNKFAGPMNLKSNYEQFEPFNIIFYRRNILLNNLKIEEAHFCQSKISQTEWALFLDSEKNNGGDGDLTQPNKSTHKGESFEPT